MSLRVKRVVFRVGRERLAGAGSTPLCIGGGRMWAHTLGSDCLVFSEEGMKPPASRSPKNEDVGRPEGDRK